MKAVFFDLDNTLYDSRQYFRGVFREISGYLWQKYGIPRKKIYRELSDLWQKKTSAYPYLFNDLLDVLDINGRESVKNIVGIFNNYKGNLNLYAGNITILKKLKKLDYKLGIITDGDVERQKRKIWLLGIKNFFDIIIYTKEIEPKPSKKPFSAAVKKIKIIPQNIFYIADNPLIDFEGAKKVGMKTIRILRGEFKDVAKNKYIDFEIDKFNEIFNLIK